MSIAKSKITIPDSVRSLTLRVMKEILRGEGAALDTFPDNERGDVYVVDLEKLRIVIMKGLSIAYQIGQHNPRRPGP